STHIGSIAEGKRADLVLWDPAFFGVKPEMVLMNGMIVVAQMGDPNASIPTPQPVYTRSMFGAMGGALAQTSVCFVSAAAQDAGVRDTLGLAKQTLAVENTRNIGKKDLIHNSATPDVEVHPETYEVRADGELLTCAPADVLPMAQRYFMF
ncbi:MAG: amidohydrolase family protein, partial [Octadecabacter sp.]